MNICFTISKTLVINSNLIRSIRRSISTVMGKKALLLGVYENADDKEQFVLTKAAKKFDETVNGKLTSQINILGPIKKNKCRVFYSLNDSYEVVTAVGLGPHNAGFNESEEVEEDRENIRGAVSQGARTLRGLGSIDEVDVDDCGDPIAAAEGGHLGLWTFDELKTDSQKKSPLRLNLYEGSNSELNQKWEFGCHLANGQNTVRRLMELPANILTPTKFASIANELFEKLNVQVVVHDQKWAESMKMGSFLSVSKGSDEPPVFLELHYNNAPNKKPVVLVGKGITFDSGGISLKPSSNMDRMRADMGGAANVLGTILTLARINAPVNVIGLTPLCENLPSGKANKPGDVVTAMNGKTIQIDNTDAEGRLILADGLCYAHKFDPSLILDIATLTGAIAVALGSSATGVFATSTKTWNLLQKSGIQTGDRMWRMPLFQHFTKQITDGPLGDLVNIGKYAGQGGSCVAAAFLKEFIIHPNWLHLDIAGVMDNKDEVPYLTKGMSGRPMRTLVYFVNSLFNE